MRIIFNPSTGITQDNINPAWLAIAKSISVDNNRNVVIDSDVEAGDVDRIFHEYAGPTGLGISWSDSYEMVIISRRLGVTLPAPNVTTPAPTTHLRVRRTIVFKPSCEIGIPEVVGEWVDCIQAVQTLQESGFSITVVSTSEAIKEYLDDFDDVIWTFDGESTYYVIAVPGTVEIDEADDEHECDPVEPPPREEAPRAIAPIPYTSGTVPFDTVPITDELMQARLATLGSPEQASQISLYQSKVNEFNRAWGNVVALKRSLDAIMKAVSSSDLFTKMKSDVEYLRERCGIIIDQIGFRGDADIVVTTKEIVTAFLADGVGRRRVGRMQISINTRYLYSANPPDADFVKAIRIINLDRNPSQQGASYWPFGHAWIKEVNAREEICFGQYVNDIFNAFASRDLPTLINIIITFLLNPDINDAWGSKIRLFPEVINEA